MVHILEGGHGPKLQDAVLAVDDRVQLVLVLVADYCRTRTDFVQPYVLGITHQRHRDRDPGQTPGDDADGVAPDGRRTDPRQILDHQPEKCAQERTQQVRLGVPVPREHVGVVRSRQHAEPFV